MAFISNQLQVSNQPNSQITTPDASNQLSSQELIFLLDTLKRATFTGEQVEIMYNTTLKLQNQYLEQNKK
jgi:hypothetical protein